MDVGKVLSVKKRFFEEIKCPMHPFDRLGTSQSALEKNDSGSGKKGI